MKIESARKIASEFLNVGVSRVWISPEAKERIKNAMTREDIKALIKEKLIKKKPGFKSRARARVLEQKRKKGRRKGRGSKKGTQKARINPKRQWIKTIRAIRRLLRKLKEEKKLSKEEYRKHYLYAKAGKYRSKAALLRGLNKEV